MESRIIYKNLDNSVGVLIPTEEVMKFATLLEVAEKDVPHNLPYWIVPTTSIPTDRTDRNRWVLEDMPEPNGFGGESNEFSDDKLKKLYNQGVIK